MATLRSIGLVVGLSALIAGCTNAAVDGGKERGGGGSSGDPTGAVAGPARFFLPTGEPHNTSAPTVEVDAKGGVHMVYPAYGNGGAYYAYCAPGCADEKAVAVVHLDSKTSVANAMLALDAGGVPHVLLGASHEVWYAHPTGDFTQASAWRSTVVLEHAGAREVTGEAFALDREGRPRFLMHTYVALLGIGQKAPETSWVACDSACDDAASWTASRISSQTWQSSQLRFDAQNRAKVATVVRAEMNENSSGKDVGAYLEASGDPSKEASWSGIAFPLAYSSSVKAVPMRPAISMALTKSGAPRVLLMATDSQTSGKRQLMYFECDSGCTDDHWRAQIVTDDDRIAAGIDLALDAADRPRFAYTLDYDIGIAACDAPSCASEGAHWITAKVEAGSDMPTDQIFLWPNCTVGAWFLHSPSIALTPGGQPRVGYQARDISGGVKNEDKTKPRCEAGTDMTLSRLAMLPSVK